MTVASCSLRHHPSWLGLGAVGSPKTRARILGLTLALYLCLFLAAAGQIGSWTWDRGEHVTPEHLTYHTLLLQLGIPDHHGAARDPAVPGWRAIERVVQASAPRTPTFDAERSVANVVSSVAQHLTAADAAATPPGSERSQATVASAALPAGRSPSPLEPPPRRAA